MYEDLIEQCLEIIEESLYEKVNSLKLAEQLFLSPYYFQRLFRKYVGDSVMEYIRKRRLTKAAEELCRTDNPVLDIALKYGYQSHEGFTRAFKEYHGITPRQCRQFHVFMDFQRKKEEWKGESIIESYGQDLKGKMEKERESMKQNFTKSVEKVITLWKELIVEIKETAEGFSNNLQKENGNFRVIAEELNGLGNQMKFVLRTVEREMDKENFWDIDQCFFTIHLLNKLVFQANMIAFNAELQLARSIEETKETFKTEVKKCRKIADYLTSSRKSPSSNAKSVKWWVGTCPSQSGYKPRLTSCKLL